MYLFVNNLEENKIVLGIRKNNNFFWFFFNSNNKNEEILQKIEKFLKTIHCSINSLKGIIVINGPGSFVGIRVALSIVNTLALVLKIPAIGINLQKNKNNRELFKQGLFQLRAKKKSSLVIPFYGKEPNINRTNKPR